MNGIIEDSTLFKSTKELRKQLNKHSKKSLIQVVKLWLNDINSLNLPRFKKLDENQNENENLVNAKEPRNLKELREFYTSFEKTKKALVDRIYEQDWKHGLCYLQVAQLDYQYHISNSSRQWSAKRLIYPETRGYKRPVMNPLLIKRGLSIGISPFSKHHIHIESSVESMWIRIMIFDSLPIDIYPPSAHIVYIIWERNSDYILMSGGKMEWNEFLKLAIIRTFDAIRIEGVELRGKDRKSLHDLLLNSNSVGFFTKYRLGKVDENPLLPKYKRTKYDDKIGEAYVNANDTPHIIMEDMEIKIQRDTNVGEYYGREEISKIEKLEYEMRIPIIGRREGELGELGEVGKVGKVGELGKVGKVKVEFEGVAVFEGLRRLVECGIAKEAGPEWLWDAMSKKTNKLVVDN